MRDTEVRPSGQDTEDGSRGRQKKSIRTRLVFFCQHTSLHGASRVVSPELHIIKRILWLLLILTATGFAAYNVAQIVIDFMGHPVSTVVTVEYKDHLPFPAVTICNLNQIRFSKFSTKKFCESEFAEIADSIWGICPQTPPPTNTANSTSSEENAANIRNTSSIGVGKTRNARDTFDDFYNKLVQEQTQSHKVAEFLDSLNKQERYETGHLLHHMLILCQYQEVRCTASNFSGLWSHTYGNCYTFNKKSEAEHVSKPGPKHGLSLVLDTQSEEYLGTSDTLGFKIVVHEQNDMPFPGDEGVVVAPGTATYIAISLVDISRKEAPYGRCHDYNLEENRRVNMYAKDFEVGYTDKACLRSCYQRSVIRLCDCCDADYPCPRETSDVELEPAEGKETTTVNNNTGNNTGDYQEQRKGKANETHALLKYCNTSKPVTYTCMQRVRYEFLYGDLACGDTCLPACRERVYEVEVSAGVWPTKRALSDSDWWSWFALRFDYESEKDAFQLARENIAKVKIFYKQLNYEKIRAFPTYNGSRLLSDLGGQLGLWLGFSLLTAVEIMELLLSLGRRLLLKICGQRQPSNVHVTTAKETELN